MSVPDPYKVLQVDPGADSEVIDAAYKRLAKKYHPDVAADPDSKARMVQINQARDILRDPVRRAAVDRARSRAAATSARVAAADGRAHATANSAPYDPDHGYRQPATGKPFAQGPAANPGVQPAGASEPRQGRAHSWPFPGMADTDQGALGDRPSTAWPAGRSSQGHGYDASTMGTAQGNGAAGPPPGNPKGSILGFGRYNGWSLGEVARVDLEYIEWLDRMPIGRTYVAEIDQLLRQHGRRVSKVDASEARHGLFRRR